ncbi:single-stranded DNA-binding protein [Streptomyces sp. NPDC059874]|uniref:single-stranded DNA-binding protein n=1 Tax=Streptomyces sp. NPDC059874 TaxID=3346983 RepID=UPI0036467D66
MTERARPTFDGEAVAKALRTTAQEVTDPAYGEGQHFQVQSDKAFLSLDTFPEAGVSRITTKSARIELFGASLPHVEDEGIVFLQKDEEHEHSTVAVHPDGALTLGYQVDTGPTSVTGLPDDVEDTAQIITNHEAVNTPAEVAPPEAQEPRVVVASPKPPEKAGTAQRASGAFPDERPMIQQVGPPSLDETGSTPQDDVEQVADGKRSQDEHPLDRAARIRAQDQADRRSVATTPDAKESTDAPRVKLVGRIGRTPTVRETAGGKLVAKFPLAIHLEDGTTKWQDVLAFNDRAAALQQRLEAGELMKGYEVEVVGYLHEREYQGRDGTTKTAQEVYSVAVKRR